MDGNQTQTPVLKSSGLYSRMNHVRLREDSGITAGLRHMGNVLGQWF